MIFRDRAEAGRALAEEVARRLPPDVFATGATMLDAEARRPLVLALPRGGVPVAAPVAERIGGDLDVVIVRKIGAPRQPEFGIGAIAEDGSPVFDETALRYLGLTEADLAMTVEAERAELSRRAHQYRAGRPPPDVTDRVVVVVDDGLATGVTAHAALRWLRGQRPGLLILAVPVCSPQAVDVLRDDADAIVYLSAPEDFSAVGRWYANFNQLTDADVDATLARGRDGGIRPRSA